MTRGFAAIAWPAKHGNSGVMTFIVNQRDIVFQKDLGADTEQAVAAIQAFDPDESWEPTAESLPPSRRVRQHRTAASRRPGLLIPAPVDARAPTPPPGEVGVFTSPAGAAFSPTRRSSSRGASGPGP